MIRVLDMFFLLAFPVVTFYRFAADLNVRASKTQSNPTLIMSSFLCLGVFLVLLFLRRQQA